MLLALAGSALNLVVLWQVLETAETPRVSLASNGRNEQKISLRVAPSSFFRSHPFLACGRVCRSTESCSLGPLSFCIPARPPAAPASNFSISSFRRSCNLLLYPTATQTSIVRRQGSGYSAWNPVSPTGARFTTSYTRIGGLVSRSAARLGGFNAARFCDESTHQP